MENQELSDGCGENSAVETVKEISTPPAPRRGALFIFDDELRERYGDPAEMIIDALDRLPATQKGYATRPPEARYRPAVEEWLKANGHG